VLWSFLPIALLVTVALIALGAQLGIDDHRDDRCFVGRKPALQLHRHRREHRMAELSCGNAQRTIIRRRQLFLDGVAGQLFLLILRATAADQQRGRQCEASGRMVLMQPHKILSA